jgi:hypothetical protein
MTLPKTPEREGPGRAGRVVSPWLWVRVLHIVLWVVVATGPVVAAVAIADAAALRREVEVMAPVELPADTGPAEGAAVLALVDHLTPPSAAGEGSGWVVENTVTLRAIEVAPGRFVVTLAAHLAPVDSGDAADPAGVPERRRLVFTVEVADTTAGWVAGTPGMIAAPVVAADTAPTGRQSGGLDGWPGLEDTLTRFVSALLTGDGELARYAAPDTDLAPVEPVPFSAVSLVEADAVATGDGSLEVNAVVEGATGPDGAHMVLGYRLVVAQRDGRWEVTALSPLPAPDTVDLSSQGG